MDVAAPRDKSRVTLAQLVEDTDSEDGEQVHPHIVLEDVGRQEVDHGSEVQPELGGNDHSKHGRVLVGEHRQVHSGLVQSQHNDDKDTQHNKTCDHVLSLYDSIMEGEWEKLKIIFSFIVFL